ncbi:metallophosphoesterase [Saxibacter everestensis]|uniref:Metallophosphoesterase n=1 Tax=Saxibacter everestensis TaxID=2909229 RepID=A0ABY8QYS3_9MICO|nr:metallophosphoesterase [Brevibacteriaceae bacterium ZFBP1038]
MNRTYRILHFSDPHLVADGGLHHGQVDTAAALRLAFDAAADVDHVDIVVGSGDLSDDGSIESYENVRSIVEPWAFSRGACVVYAMGNHDDRDKFSRVLGNGHPARHTRDGGSAAVDPGQISDGMPIDGVSQVGGLRVITLDTSVPGAGYGEISPGQLGWLARQLAVPAADGTLLVLHHPPVQPMTALHQALKLRNPAELAQVLSGSDVRLVLAGHYHHQLNDSLAGIPVVVTPGIANRTDVTVAAGHERAVRGTAMTLVDLPPGALPRTVVIDCPAPDDGAEVYHYGTEDVARILSAAVPDSGQ